MGNSNRPTNKTLDRSEKIPNIQTGCIFDEKSGKLIPLKKVQIDITIKGFITSVESILTFENLSDKPLEAVFRFPIDDSSAVYKFEAELEGRKIVAECQEKKQAKEVYDAAVQSGHTATLLEEEDLVSDIFICKIGNLLSKKKATVKFSYVTDITIQADGTLKYILPTLLNPRYNPTEDNGGLKQTPPMKSVPANKQPYDFDVNVSVSGLDVVKITSQKDNISISNENGITSVKLNNKFIADHDFELEINVKEPFKPFFVVEKGSEDKEGILKQDVVMLNFFPQLDESNMSNQHEFLFVIDRSGSMEGSRIESAKESLLLFIKSLPSDCYFNIIGFGSSFEVLFKEGSEKYTKESLEKALEHQQTLSADLGGTEILEPLVHIYSKPFLPTHSRNIFLITDGEVFNTEAVINLVQKHSHDTRVFTLGIGEGASTALIKGVARAGKGKAEFVKTDDKMSPIVIKLLKCAMQSTFTDVKIDWQLNGSNEFIQIPKVIPSIFHNDHTVVYALLKNFSGGKATLSGKIGDQSYEFPLSLSDVQSSENSDLPIHRMAAEAEILRLLTTDEKESNKSEIVLLSIASNIISRYTAMVGVDKIKNELVIEDMVTCLVPTITDPTLIMRSFGMRGGYATAHGGVGMAMPMMCCAAAPPQHATRMLKGGGFFLKMPKKKLKMEAFSTYNADTSDYIAESQTKQPDNFISLVSLQSFDGNWILDETTCSLLNSDLKSLSAKSPVTNHNVWATVLVLAFFRKKYLDRIGEWEMIELKSKKWLSQQNMEGKTQPELFDYANEIYI